MVTRLSVARESPVSEICLALTVHIKHGSVCITNLETYNSIEQSYYNISTNRRLHEVTSHVMHSESVRQEDTYFEQCL